MKHLFNISVYHDPSDVSAVLDSGLVPSLIDGVELLTGYSPAPKNYPIPAVTVHLPYAIDWYSPWTCGNVSNVENMGIEYLHYGRNSEEIVTILRKALESATPLKPDYGVFHAGCGILSELMCSEYSVSNKDMAYALCDMMNAVLSGKEPPFTIAFENTWWPGFRALDGEIFKIMANKLEFNNWGLCIDTGHLLVASGRSVNENSAIDILNECADKYPDEMIDRIIGIHLHRNESAAVSGVTHITKEECESIPLSERISMAGKFVGLLDAHMPFTNRKIEDYVQRLNPKHLVHELSALPISAQIEDYKKQRALFC